jgi:hypothetical protein
MTVRQKVGLMLLGTAAAEKLPAGDARGGASKPAEEDTPGTTPATKRAMTQEERFRDSAQKLIDRTDTAAKTIATLGTTGISALGIARISDLFPNPYGDSFWDLLSEPAPIAMFVGFIAMIVGVIVLARGFWKLQQPLIVGADSQKMETDGEIDEKEKKLVDSVYGEMKDANDGTALVEYQKAGWQADEDARAAEEADPKKAARLRAQGDEIASEVLATMARARLNVLRHRSTQALRSRWAVGSLTAILLGVLVFSVGADAVESDRTGELALAKTCAEVRALAKVQESEVDDDVCGVPPTSSADEDSPQEVAGAAVTALSEAATECRKTAAKSGSGEQDCGPLAQALEAAASAMASK